MATSSESGSGPHDSGRFAEGACSLIEVTDAFAAAGYSEQMQALPGGRIRCGHCGHEAGVNEFAPGPPNRVEGASDPGDMAAAIATTCPNCSSRGALVVRYGPEADIADSDVLAALPKHERD